jgi:hypothetical protein
METGDGWAAVVLPAGRAWIGRVAVDVLLGVGAGCVRCSCLLARCVYCIVWYWWVGHVWRYVLCWVPLGRKESWRVRFASDVGSIELGAGLVA